MTRRTVLLAPVLSDREANHGTDHEAHQSSVSSVIYRAKDRPNEADLNRVEEALLVACLLLLAVAACSYSESAPAAVIIALYYAIMAAACLRIGWSVRRLWHDPAPRDEDRAAGGGTDDEADDLERRRKERNWRCTAQ